MASERGCVVMAGIGRCADPPYHRFSKGKVTSRLKRGGGAPLDARAMMKMERSAVSQRRPKAYPKEKEP